MADMKSIVETKLTKEFSPVHLNPSQWPMGIMTALAQQGLQDVVDITAEKCDTSFNVLIVSDKFTGKPLLQRHRMVNSCLEEELKSIHAFTMKTLTPEQWEKQKT